MEDKTTYICKGPMNWRREVKAETRHQAHLWARRQFGWEYMANKIPWDVLIKSIECSEKGEVMDVKTVEGARDFIDTCNLLKNPLLDICSTWEEAKSRFDINIGRNLARPKKEEEVL